MTGEGFDPNGAFVHADGNQADVSKETEVDLWGMLAVSAYAIEARLIEVDGRPAI